ncbi:MAG: oligosaccharide flippase family protein [Gemmatimonadota bacterium]|nr:oligosaccharide flippase family protein [Gemmatimonadota bacterium]
MPAPAPEGGSQLGRETVTSGLATIGARGLQAALLLGTAVALARLLTPEDFGVFAMIVPLGIIASNITNRAVQTALLQADDLSDPGLDAFFWLIARVTLLVAAALAGSGFVLAAFYSEPRVVPIALAWAGLLLLLVPATFQEALLKRRLRFPVVMAVQVTGLVVGIVVSLVAAWGGWGYWALALQVFVMEAGRAIGIAFLSDWRPRAPRGRDAAESTALRRAWAHLAGVRVSTWLTDLPGVVAVGRIGGATVLGHYHTARRWASYPFEEPFLALTDVSIASLRHVRDDAERFRRLAGRALLVMLAISLPAMAFIVVEARTVVLVVLGPQWVDAIWFLRVLSLAAFAIALIRVNRWIYLAQGRTGRLLAWSLFIETPVAVVAVSLGTIWGAPGVAVAVAIGAAVLVLPSILFAVKGSPLRFVDVIRATIRPVLASVLAAAALAASAGVLPAGSGADRLAVAVTLFGVAFLAAWHAIPGGLDDTRMLWAALRASRERQ